MPDAPPAPVTRTGAHADQRRRIFRSAGELLAKRGYADVTVELIVKRAHCSYKTYYKHFENKEDCYLAFFDSAVRNTKRQVRERLDVEPGDWPDQVVLALRTLVELICAEPLLARAVIVESPTIGPAITDRYEQATRLSSPSSVPAATSTHAAKSFPTPSRTLFPARSSGPPTSASSSERRTSCPPTCPSCSSSSSAPTWARPRQATSSGARHRLPSSPPLPDRHRAEAPVKPG